MTIERPQLTVSERELMSRLGELLRRNRYRDERILARVPHRGDPEGITAPWMQEQVFDCTDPFDALVVLF